MRAREDDMSQGCCRRILVMTAAAGACWFGGSPAAAKDYVFHKIADVVPTGALGAVYPAINNDGTVAFIGTLTGQLSPATYRGDGGPLTTIANGLYTGVRAPSINDSGRVAFFADVGPGLTAFRVHTGTGGGLTTITPTPGPLRVNGGGEPAPSIAADGSVVFFDENDGFVSGTRGTRVFVGSGGALRTVASTTSYFGFGTSGSLFAYPAISKDGKIAYLWRQTSADPQQLLIDDSGVKSTLVTLPTFGASITSLAVNDLGTVAFVGSLDFSTPGLFLADADSSDLAIGAEGPYRLFNTASINNRGDLAFWAQLDSLASGLYTGADPARDKVVQTGDALDGSTIKRIDFGRNALNDFGQVTFAAVLDDGREGVFRASPIESDIDHDGRITAADYFRIDFGFASGLTGRHNGDLNYSGSIDSDDFAIIDRAFLAQSQAAARLGAAATAPEPGVGVFLIWVGLMTIGRRRRVARVSDSTPCAPHPASTPRCTPFF